MGADVAEKAGALPVSGARGQATGATPASAAEERQQLTRSRIRRAAMEVVARRGFDATVEEIAEVSCVSARTIFRHFVSHDRLIAETVRDMFRGLRPAATKRRRRPVGGGSTSAH
jgi:AcrR family transcriptional regulator